MARRFEKQVAIITGGADGLGKGIAVRLASEGAAIAIFDFNEAKMKETADELTASGSTCTAVKVDISDEQAVHDAVAEVIKSHGKVDVMVNCAGIVGPNGKKVQDVEGASFDQVMAVNVKGTFNMTKACIPHMVEKNYGRILLIASIAGKEGNAGMTAYSTSKAAVIGFTKAVGKEYAETGITVNALAPAVIRTAMVDGMEPEQVKYMTDKIPMKRCGLIEEVASAVAFYVSPEASFTTGFCHDLTGGRATY